ncbi:MAG: holo-ACP synthase [Phycisphaerales bacterium]|nr:holo-ACP synthase [Phycisphaerales bacterium]
MRIIGHGIDLVEVARIARMLEAHQDRAIERLFTADERAECAGDARAPARYAARFAAKEAAMKALGAGPAGGVNWKDFSVRNNAAGAPVLVVTGRAAEIAAGLGITGWSVSLTHTGEYAAASVIATG